MHGGKFLLFRQTGIHLLSPGNLDPPVLLLISPDKCGEIIL